MDAEKNKRERRRILQQRRQDNAQNRSLQSLHVLQNIQVNARREIRSTQQQLRRTNQQQHQPQLAN